MFWPFPLSPRHPTPALLHSPRTWHYHWLQWNQTLYLPSNPPPFLGPLTALLSQLREDVCNPSLCFRFFPSFVTIPVSSGFLRPIATLPLVVLKEPRPFAVHLDVGLPKGSFPSTSLWALLANLRASVTVWVERASRASASKTWCSSCRRPALHTCQCSSLALPSNRFLPFAARLGLGTRGTVLLAQLLTHPWLLCLSVLMHVVGKIPFPLPLWRVSHRLPVVCRGPLALSLISFLDYGDGLPVPPLPPVSLLHSSHCPQSYTLRTRGPSPQPVSRFPPALRSGLLRVVKNRRIQRGYCWRQPVLELAPA